MSGKKTKKKGLKKKPVTKDFGFGNLGLAADIGVPAAVTDGNSSFGNNPMAPQTSISYWPAPNLWYAQGKNAAKKAYFEYINTLNQYTATPNDQSDRKLGYAGKLNETATSMIQGVALGTEALENAQRRVRIADQAAVIEKEVITDVLTKLLKTIWVHNTAAYSQNFPGLEIKIVEPSLVSRLNRVNSWGVTDVGIPLANAQEAETLWLDETPVMPTEVLPDAGEEAAPETAAEEETTPEEEQTIELADEPGENELPADAAPSSDNQAQDAFVNATDAGESADEGDELPVEMPEEHVEDTPEDKPELDVAVNGSTPEPDTSQQEGYVPSEEELEQSEEASPEEEVIEDMPDDELTEEEQIENPEEEATEIPEDEVVEEQEETPLEEDEGQIDNPVESRYVGIKNSFEELKAQDPEAAAQLLDELTAESDEEVEKFPEEGIAEGEEFTEDVPDEEFEETPEEPIYCIHCDRDVTQADIDTCEEEGCPFRQGTEEVAEEEEPEEETVEIEEPEPKEKHFILLDQEDHCNCPIHQITIKDFDGVEGKYCMTHGMIEYAFDQSIWSSDDAKAWVQKQYRIQKEKNKSALEIVAENIDSIDDTVLKEWAQSERSAEEAPDTVEFEVDDLLQAVTQTLDKKLGPLTRRLQELEY